MFVFFDFLPSFCTSFLFFLPLYLLFLNFLYTSFFVPPCFLFYLLPYFIYLLLLYFLLYCLYFLLTTYLFTYYLCYHVFSENQSSTLVPLKNV